MSTDFHYNKRVLDDVALIPTKRIRNKIAGYATRLMRRIQTGPVRGISLKLQEEERERSLDFVPEVCVNYSNILHSIVLLFILNFSVLLLNKT
jgi:small subunit ribosomal protein S17e